MKWEVRESQAESYHAYLVPAMLIPFARELISIGRLQSGERVLDVGCGTGVVSRLAAPIVGASGKVVGLDIDQEMLAVARGVGPVEGAAIDWGQGDVVNMPFQSGSFDVALCQAALQFFPRRRAALHEIGRVLASRGRLVVSCFGSIERNRAFHSLARALERHIGQEAGEMRRAIFALGELEELLSLLTAAGFNENRSVVAVRNVHFPSPEEFLRRQIVSQSPWLLNEMDQATQAALIEEMDRSLAEFVGSDGLVFPMEAHIVEAF